MFGATIFVIAIWLIVRYPWRSQQNSSLVGVSLICYGALFAATITQGRAWFGLWAPSRYSMSGLLMLTGCYLAMLGRVPGRGLNAMDGDCTRLPRATCSHYRHRHLGRPRRGDLAPSDPRRQPRSQFSEVVVPESEGDSGCHRQCRQSIQRANGISIPRGDSPYRSPTTRAGPADQSLECLCHQRGLLLTNLTFAGNDCGSSPSGKACRWCQDQRDERSRCVCV